MTAKPRKSLLVNVVCVVGALLVALPVLYVISFGPACWLTSKVVGVGFDAHPAMVVYWPLARFAANNKSGCADALRWWITVGLKAGERAVVPIDSGGELSATWE